MVVLFLFLMGVVAGDNGVRYKLQHNNIVVVLFGIFGGGSRKLFLVSFHFCARQTAYSIRSARHAHLARKKR